MRIVHDCYGVSQGLQEKIYKTEIFLCPAFSQNNSKDLSELIIKSKLLAQNQNIQNV